MMNPVPWLQMTNMISYQGLVRTFPKRAAEAIHNKGVKNTVITLGSKGSLAFDGKKFR